MITAAFLMMTALQAMAPMNLRCMGRSEPSGVDVLSPVLSWKFQGSSNQAAYRILVASSPKLLEKKVGDFWDSGRQEGSETLGHKYAGKSLSSEARYYWKVETWTDGSGSPSWSATSQFTTGILKKADWKGKWIGAAKPSETLMIRKTFHVDNQLQFALFTVCGLGDCETTVNGHRMGVDRFGPGWTNYRKTCLYQSFDLTHLLKAGDNAVGLLLGNGMYNVHEGRYTKFTGTFGDLQATGQIMLQYRDGHREWIPTGTDWLTLPGPITFSSVYGGEDFDARLEPKGWNEPGFKQGEWAQASETHGPGGELAGLSRSAEVIGLHETLTPVKITPIKPGVDVYDFGQNVSIMPQMVVQGESGSQVRMIPAELVNKDGTVDRTSCGDGPAYWQYTLNGTGDEKYFPKFFYHGSRYIQVERTSSTGHLPEIKSFVAHAVYSNVDQVGSFSCSDALFNRIFTLVQWAQKSNMMSVLTDCPHRERLGWLEQTHLNGPALRYNFDISPIFGKLMGDMSDSQLENGLVPDIAPELVVFEVGFRDSPEWGSACILGAWQQYMWNGDLSIFEANYPFMRRYLDYLTTQSKNHLLDYGLGDWYDIGPNPPGYAQLTPVSLTGSAIYYEDSRILSQVAKLLGRTEESDELGSLAVQIKDSFNEKFFDANSGSYSTGSQCANAMPLSLNMVEKPEDRSRVLAALVKDIEKRGNAITAGDVGYRYLLRALAENGRSDLIVKMNQQTKTPGYGYMLEHGATALTEAWDAARSSSQNHFMLGQIVEWFYHDLVGIQPTESGAGFSKFLVKPAVDCGLSSASGSFQSVHGLIQVDWKRKQAQLDLEVHVPAGTEAQVLLPSRHSIVDGHPVLNAKGFSLRPGQHHVQATLENS